MNRLDKLRGLMSTQGLNESTREFIENYLIETEQNKEKVSSKEYIDWIYDYVSTNKQADDESAAYTYEGVDSENGQILSYFLDYIKDLAKEQRVLVCDDGNLDSEEVVVKIKNKYFRLFRMHGQGSWTSIGLLNEEPNHAFVKLIL